MDNGYDTFSKFEHAIALDPYRTDLRRQYGTLLFRSRRFSEAAKSFAQWARLSQGADKSLALTHLARTLIKLGLLDHARSAAELAATDDSALFAAARILRRISDIESGVVEDASRTGTAPHVEEDLDTTPLEQESKRPKLAISPEQLLRSRLALAIRALDFVVELTSIEKSIIVRNFQIQNNKSVLEPVRNGLLLFVTVICHVFFFYVIGKGFPGEISYLSATLAAFMIWNCFKQAKSRIVPFMAEAGFNRSSNLKWIHLFLADVAADVIKIILSSVLIIILAHLVIGQPLSGPFIVPNLPLLSAVIALAILLGTGTGVAIASLSRQWRIFAALDHILMWILFVTSGVYEAYVQLPTAVAPYFKFNPVLTIVEYSRMSFDEGYPVADLTLTLPFWSALALLVLGLSLYRQERQAALAVGV